MCQSSLAFIFKIYPTPIHTSLKQLSPQICTEFGCDPWWAKRNVKISKEMGYWKQ